MRCRQEHLSNGVSTEVDTMRLFVKPSFLFFLIMKSIFLFFSLSLHLSLPLSPYSQSPSPSPSSISRFQFASPATQDRIHY